jgi:serine/threonine protein phosphatase PrpC
MAIALRSHARTDVGRVRDHNEDNFLVDRKLGLFVVADGMGGHASGEVASAVAVHALREALKKDADFIEDFVNDDKSVRPEDIRNLLEAAAHAANSAVFQEAQNDPEKRGMGTTLTAMMLLNGHGFIAHVGDSRAYLLRGGEVRMLTEDHSVINELKRRGKLKPELVEKMQIKNAVTRAVGVFETVEVDTFHFLVAPGDRFVLCSDGLHGYVDSDAELTQLVAGLSEEMATQRLIDIANERGGKDNITAIVVAIPEEGTDAASDVALSYETLANMPFFRFLEPRELLRVQALARPRSFTDGEIVVKEGDAGDSIFVVLKGQARVRKGDADIAKLGAGEHFGEMALVDKTPRSATVVSDGPSRMLEISRQDFFKILREERDIGIKLLWNFVNVLTQRLRSTSAALGEAKEALQAEDLTDVLFAEDEQLPSIPRLPSIPNLRGCDAAGAREHAATMPVPVGSVLDDMPTIPPPPSGADEG